MALTIKQRAFVDAYLETMNATKAAKLAGYSQKTAYSIGQENLKKPEITAEIEKRLNENAMPANEVIARLSDHARGDIGEFLNTPFEELADHPRSNLLKKIKRTVRRQKDGDEIETIEFELHDPQAALVQLGRYHALFTDKQEVSATLRWDELIKKDLDDAHNAGDTFA